MGFRIFALIVALGVAWQGQAQDAKATYPSMAPIEQYLMDRNAEIALARSAAPAAISRDAEVLVLGRKGYETAIKGKNGFVCVVERSWGSDFDDPQFWNPRIRGPVCYNPPAARSVLPARAKRQEMILAGLSKTQVFDGIKTAFGRKELPYPEPGSMCYMMSKEAYLNDRGSHNLAHLMFEIPRMDGAALGADLPESPVIVGTQDGPEPITEFIVPVGNWSDGTAAQAEDAQATYTSMAPLDQYLMSDRNAEIALARSAAPESISRDAEVLVLGQRGYETAVKGKNGFVCVVERSWMAPFDDPEFLNPDQRLPLCLNPAAARSHLPLTLKTTEFALAGWSKTQMFDRVKAAFDKKELPMPESGAMCYMMSKQQYFGRKYGNADPHLMFWFPKTDDLFWGAGVPGSPVYVHQYSPQPITEFIISVSKWSDGTAAPTDEH